MVVIQVTLLPAPWRDASGSSPESLLGLSFDPRILRIWGRYRHADSGGFGTRRCSIPLRYSVQLGSSARLTGSSTARRRLSALLASEIASPGRKPASRNGVARIDPADEPRESALG